MSVRDVPDTYSTTRSHPPVIACAESDENIIQYMPLELACSGDRASSSVPDLQKCTHPPRSAAARNRPSGEKVTASTGLVHLNRPNLAILLCATSHTRMMLSSNPEASHRAFGENLTVFTPSVCPYSSSPTESSLFMSQILTVWSADAEAIKRPSGEMVTECTAPSCPKSG